METATEKRKTAFLFTYLPAFAKFLLQEHRAVFAEEQLRLSHELNLQHNFSENDNAEFLEYLAEDRAAELIENWRQQWLKGELPNLARERMVAECITGVSYMRKQIFLRFIPLFITDVTGTIELLNEIDQFIFASDTILINTYISIVTNKRETLESQRFIQKIADATPAIIASYNINTGQYRFVSEGLQKLLGYDPGRPLKEGVAFFIDIVHPDDLAPIMEKNTQALELANSAQLGVEGSEAIVEFEYRMRHANGEYRWFHTFGTVFDRNESAQVEHVLNISIDITERKEMETALSQKNVQLQQSNANLEEFAYVASHDLKEPLRKISIFGDRLLSTQYERLAGEGQFYLEKIIDSSRKMQLLINDMLSLSLISGNKSFVRYSLQSILTEVMRTLEFKIEETGATIHAQPLPEANIIPSQFRQLFQNLISNSLKFVRQGVKPGISISCRKLRHIEVERHDLPKAAGYLELTFMDNGIGFDNIFAGKIFAIFQRLHHKDYEGTGIGLAICKKIIENHGGVIHAAGIPGQGATFIIIIPV